MEHLWIACWVVGLAVVSAVIGFGILLGWIFWG